MTYYEILEVTENASDTVIHMAYKTLAEKYHPDFFDGDFCIAEEKMKQLSLAYSILSNSDMREQYDAYLKSQRATGNVEKLPLSDNKQNVAGNKAINRRKVRKSKFVILAVVLAIVVAVCLVLQSSKLGDLINKSPITPLSNIERIKDSVVMVEVYDAYGNLSATGSGFCAYKENWIVTNFHVIEGAKTIAIITDDREKISVDNIVLFNKKYDLAVLSIDGSLNPLKLGDGNDIKTKDNITTIGSPKGELNTVSEGIISNVDNKDEIRITAPISHGSSGGVLLNRKNEVIGITSAGYEDAQNLNFAINVTVLESLYSDFVDNKVVTITSKNFSRYIGNLSTFEDYMNSSTTCYGVSSLDIFHSLTDIEKRFEYLLGKMDYSWYSIYNSLSTSDQKEVISLFTELNAYSFDNKNIEADIKNWSVTDFFISLDVLNRYEYAITVVDIGNYSDNGLIFDNVNNNYPLEAAEKSLILYLIGNHEWYEIHTDNKEDIFNYFDAKYGTEDLGAILETLGYEVAYNNDGTLTGYW